MPKKDEYDDDFESEEEPETLIAKPMSKSKSGNKRASRKASRRTGSPARVRAHSAPGSKSARDLWINAVKTRSTAKLANGRPPESPRRKTPVEYWVDTLRRSRTGISTESTGMNSFTGLKKDNKHLAYLSTPSYLRQLAGTEKPRREADLTNRSAPGTPAYKSSEEYYDEVIQLKKQVVALNHEVSTVRAKLRRTEEDNIKKGKDIEQLLDPSKSEELRRTLGDRKPESGAVIHSLKQKILKLETQLRDKETAYTKLQSDLKTTKLDEMKTQMDVLYQEIVRLHNTKDTGFGKATRPSKENTVKVKALNETILRLNENNQTLMTENKTLKEDLQKALDDGAVPKSERMKDYADMNKRELLSTLSAMKKRLDKAERAVDLADGDSISQLSVDSRRGDGPVSGKIVLEGSTEERLTQLDHRETELLDENQRLKTVIKRLREDRQLYRTQPNGKSLDHRSPRPEGSVSGRVSRRGSTPRGRTPTPRERILTPRDRLPSPGARKSRQGSVAESSRSSYRSDGEDLRKRAERFQRNHAAKSIQREWRAHRSRQEDEQAQQFEWRIRHFLENRSAKTIQREWRDYHQRELDSRVRCFREQRAAKRIQHEWKGYRSRKHEADKEDATVSIQAALRGHSARKRHMAMYRDFDDASSTLTDDSYEGAINTIQSSLRGHIARRQRMRTARYDSTADEDEDEDYASSRRRSARPLSGKSLSSSSSSRHGHNPAGRTSIFSARKSPSYDDDDDEDDDDIVVG
ncbi:IQ domain-containing protein E-like [Liolophura sinensis]|uniref:IQ domain-containing protein E-like n=1 Tax=Liolophura sinensis TaxID=3198878 RepID=UPI00315870B5